MKFERMLFGGLPVVTLKGGSHVEVHDDMWMVWIFGVKELQKGSAQIIGDIQGDGSRGLKEVVAVEKRA